MDMPEEVAAWVADHEREHGNGVAGLRAAQRVPWVQGLATNQFP